jgi:hypothetical protein
MIFLLAVTVGCSTSGQGRVVQEEPRVAEHEPGTSKPMPVAGTNPPAAQRKKDKPPEWRPVQVHVSAGPVWRWHQSAAARATMSLAKVWSRPSQDGPGSLSGPFAGVGVEGTAEANQLTLGPLFRVGMAWGEYVFQNQER